MEIQPELRPWRRADTAADVQERLRAFEDDGLAPRAFAHVRYFFAPLHVLDWPDDQDPEAMFDDVGRVFIKTFGVAAQPSEILFATTHDHGDVVVVPEHLLPPIE